MAVGVTRPGDVTVPETYDENDVPHRAWTSFAGGATMVLDGVVRDSLTTMIPMHARRGQFDVAERTRAIKPSDH